MTNRTMTARELDRLAALARKRHWERKVAQAADDGHGAPF